MLNRLKPSESLLSFLFNSNALYVAAATVSVTAAGISFGMGYIGVGIGCAIATGLAVHEDSRRTQRTTDFYKMPYFPSLSIACLFTPISGLMLSQAQNIEDFGMVFALMLTPFWQCYGDIKKGYKEYGDKQLLDEKPSSEKDAQSPFKPPQI